MVAIRSLERQLTDKDNNDRKTTNRILFYPHFYPCPTDKFLCFARLFSLTNLFHGFPRSDTDGSLVPFGPANTDGVIELTQWVLCDSKIVKPGIS